MNCPQCGRPNSAAAEICLDCGAVLADEETPTSYKYGAPADAAEEATALRPAALGGDEATAFSSPAPAMRGAEADPRSPTAFSMPSAATGAIPTYQSFGNRYEILELLGEGGMGRVYKAWDRELERVIALKTIRGDQAGKRELLTRFKQELLLAQKITHKNVIRIHDMGEADGVKFFTMEYIPGRSLKSVLDKQGKVDAAEGVPLVKQMLSALVEAHRQNVVHRDLKPHNMMVDTDGVLHIMDFGIAKSAQDTSGVTATGTVIGTPDYLSPEQARGEPADAQSDLFSLGVILYQMFTGELPFAGDTLVSKVMARLSKKPVMPRERTPELPKYLENIILKCMEVDRTLRYPSAEAILADLERESVDRSPIRRIRRMVVRHRWATAGGIALLTAVGLAVYFARQNRAPAGETTIAPRMLAILPFANASNDASLDWLGSSLADLLTTEVGQSSSLRTVSSDRVHQILSDLRIGSGSRFDPSTVVRMAELSGAKLLIAGQYLKLGETIRVDATLHDVDAERQVTLKVEAANEDALLGAVSELAGNIQENLGLSRNLLEELRASSFVPSSDSIRALRLYNDGILLSRRGNDLEALERFREAVTEDPDFALAYSKLGQTYSALGYDEDAEDALDRALSLASGVTLPERYRIQAIEAGLDKDYDKAIESYQNLVEVLPNDPEIQFSLGGLYEETGDYARARSYYQAVLDKDPDYIAALYAMGRVEIRSGSPERSLDHLNRALSLTIRLSIDEARATILNAIGVAYRFMNRGEEALRNYEEALAIRRDIGDKRGLASTLAEIGTIRESMGQLDDAMARYQESLALTEEIGDQVGTAQTLVNLGYLQQRRGGYEEALELFKGALRIQREIGNESEESSCLNNVGNVYLDQGKLGEAQTYFDLALRLREKAAVQREVAETVHNLGEVAAKTGRYDQSIGYYLRAIELSRSDGDTLGTAIESYSLGTIFGYQGRYGAAVRAMKEATDLLGELEEGGFWKSEVSIAYGGALNRIGRFAEAEKTLAEAMADARRLEIPAQIARGLSYQGDGFFYRGRYPEAQRAYERALQVASDNGDRELVAGARVRLVKLALTQGNFTSVIESSTELEPELASLGLRHLSLEISLHLGEALTATGETARAIDLLQGVLRGSEKAGLRVLLAQAHFALGKAQEERGDASEARRHRDEARRLVEAIREEAEDESVLLREDLKAMLAEPLPVPSE